VGTPVGVVGKPFQVYLVNRISRVCKAVMKAKGDYFEEFKRIFICLTLNALLVTT
jgi:hypothetical protein